MTQIAGNGSILLEIIFCITRDVITNHVKMQYVPATHIAVMLLGIFLAGAIIPVITIIMLTAVLYLYYAVNKMIHFPNHHFMLLTHLLKDLIDFWYTSCVALYSLKSVLPIYVTTNVDLTILEM